MLPQIIPELRETRRLRLPINTAIGTIVTTETGLEAKALRLSEPGVIGGAQPHSQLFDSVSLISELYWTPHCTASRQAACAKLSPCGLLTSVARCALCLSCPHALMVPNADQ